MIDIISIAAVSVIPAVTDYLILKDKGEKIRREKLKDFYYSIGE